MIRFARFAVLLVGLLVGAAARADAQAITSWNLAVYNVGAALPLSPPTVLLVANVVCNQPAPVGSNINPGRVSWDDVVTVGRACLWTDPGTGPLRSVPFGGNYEATLTATNSAATSPESARVPFTRPGLGPGAPTGVKVVP